MPSLSQCRPHYVIGQMGVVLVEGTDLCDTTGSVLTFAVKLITQSGNVHNWALTSEGGVFRTMTHVVLEGMIQDTSTSSMPDPNPGPCPGGGPDLNLHSPDRTGGIGRIEITIKHNGTPIGQPLRQIATHG